MEKVLANTVKKGNVLFVKNALCEVITEPTTTKPGKGPAYVQLEMKNVKTGIKTSDRINSGETVAKAFLETRQYQYLYKEGSNMIFMDNQTYEQIELPESIIGEGMAFLSENDMVKIEMFEESPIKVTLPPSVILEVVETDPVIKNATASSSSKYAKLSNNISIKVPGYITLGEKIVVKTEDRTFVERAK